MLIFLLVAAPWHIAATVSQPGFAWFYFINEHVLRFTGGRAPHDYPTGPPWYYLVRLPLYLFPWSVLLPLLALRGRRRVGEALLWAWVGSVILFFSFAGSKGYYYVLPAAPPLSALLALRLARQESGERFPFRALVPALAVGAGATAVALFAAERGGTLSGLGALGAPWGVAAAVAVALAASGAAVAARARQRTLAPWLLAAAGLAPVLAGVGVVSATEDHWSQRRLADAVKASYPGVPVYLYRDYEEFSSLPYYLGGRVGVVDCDSADLYYGLRLRPDAGIALTAAQLLERTRRAPALVAVRAAYADDFHRRFPNAGRLRLRSGNALLFYLD